MMLTAAEPVQAACTTSGSVVTCSGTTVAGGNGFGNGTQSNLTINVDAGASVTGGNDGLRLNSNNTVNNSGTLTGTGNAGIEASGALSVNNASSGAISGGTYGIFAVFTSVNLINAGTITGGNQYGIYAGSATIVNSGIISASSGGVSAVNVINDATITNSGTITGPRGIIAGGGGIVVLNNYGTIAGTTGSAIDFSASFTGNTLNFFSGSRIIGNIDLGAGDTVNIHSGRDIAWLLTFGACGCGGLVNTGSSAFVSGGAPYVIAGDQIATLDPTAFSLADRTLVDFTGFISSLLANRFGEFSGTGTTASAFAPVSSGGGAAAAFAYAIDSRMPNANAYDSASGIAIWSKGFAGARNQSADGPNLGARNVAFGGMIGLDKNFTPGLRLGAFLGGGNGRLNVDMDSQQVKTDYLFGGLYGRFDWTARFFDFAISGGRLSNSSTRTVANNMTPGGTEQASAKFDGWFLAPELAYGIRLPIAGGYIVTPAARLRYVAGFFDAYNETGSSQTLSVASRTTQNLEQRLEVSVSRDTSLQQGWLKTTATIGALGMERLGDTAINVVLIGQNLAFSAPGRNNVAGAYAGLNVSYWLSQTASLFAAVEATAMSDNSKTGIVQGGLRIALN